jgi:ubiquinone/menaquinone biosynthesis C-methylase UbiE
MQRSSRVDYDAIAPLYDSQPHREKSPDPALASFLAERSALGTALLLDIACGTGNQLVANRAIAPSARMVGLDGSLGMLRQARAKSAEIGWVHGDSSALPFASGMFDFANCQYALHHFRGKAGMVREAFRVLRTGGRLAIFNMCPHDSLDWLYYDYFPEALTRDLADFWPPEAIVAEMTATGFADVVVDRDHRRNERNLATFLEGLRRRDRNSQLLTLSDTAYEAGLRRLESELADPSAPRSRADHLCFVTVRGDKPLH